ncbi:MAG: hypothetical protein Q9182_005051 [Xanthomendoza sp. 2 TL-2023]
MVDWAIAEVKYKAQIFNQVDCIEALDGVWKSDTIINEELRIALEVAVQSLEDVPEADKDWHPGPDGQVLDLVHPSIYPLVYGQSPILAAETFVSDDTPGLGREWSKKFQWLPAEVDISPDGDNIVMKSYINNLHPNFHSDLFSIIPKIIAKAISMWDRVLSRLVSPPIPPRVSDWSNSYMGFDEEMPDEPEQEEGEDDNENWCRLDEWNETDRWVDNRRVIEPEPGDFQTPAERIRSDKNGIQLQRSGTRSDDKLKRPQPSDTAPCVDLRKDYGRLQVIVKLANIHLTTDKPAYPGDSYLSIRQQTGEGTDLPYEQGIWKAVEQIYGVKNDCPAIQDLGEVLTRQSRLLCSPNIMQHRVSSFQLADPFKTSHRKILALFLIDPHLRIISTENVPPQQESWWRQKVRDTGVFERLPLELAENIVEHGEVLVSLEKAREQRCELMEERKEFIKKHDQDFRNLRAFSTAL